MKNLPTVFILVSALSLLALASAQVPGSDAKSEEERQTRVSLQERFSPTLIGIELTIGAKFSGPAGPSQVVENLWQGHGTLITPDGLVVASLAALDPARQGVDQKRTQALQRPANTSSGARVMTLTPPESADILKNPRLRLENGEWIPAIVVLKDPTLDVVFLAPAPDAPARKFAFIDPNHPATYRNLGGYQTLGMDPEADWLCYPSKVDTQGELKQPYPLIMVQIAPLFAGSPVIEKDGSLLGIIVHRVIDGKTFLGKYGILPVQNLVPLIGQAQASRAKTATP